MLLRSGQLLSEEALQVVPRFVFAMPGSVIVALIACALLFLAARAIVYLWHAPYPRWRGRAAIALLLGAISSYTFLLRRGLLPKDQRPLSLPSWWLSIPDWALVALMLGLCGIAFAWVICYIRYLIGRRARARWRARRAVLLDRLGCGTYDCRECRQGISAAAP